MTISTAVDQLCDELHVGSDDREDRVVLASGRRFVARLRPLGDRSESPALPGNSPAVALHAAPSGILDGLEWKPALRRAPTANEVEIEVIAAGLNFRDVLTTLSVVPGNRERLGGECAGRVVSVGHGVTRFNIGDEVIAFALGGLASYVTVSADFVIRKPTSISLDRAAALPVAFLTALYAFRQVTTLQAGRKVLIHAATGGVGSAAVQLAKLAGAEIFGTAGTPEKRTLLKSWGVHHVFDSRDLSFADGIRAVAGERGIDVVLNSLAGEFVTRSLELVRPGGVFIELGKRDLLNPLDVMRRHAGVAYSAFDLAEVAEQSPDLIQSLFSELKHFLESKQLALLPVQIFPAQQVAAAFRYMARGSHTGKIVIGLKAGQSTSNFFSRSPIAKEGVWVITGGLGGLGMSLSEWLVDQGISRLALISRSAADGPRNRFLETLRSSGISAQTFQADVSDEGQLKDALAQVRSCLGPIRGVVHAAGTVDDGTVTQLDWSRCLAVLAPKIDGAWNLHKATAQDELDVFVLFSSAASVLGSPGQGNYCAANAFLDALAHYRHGLGLPAVSVNWSVWAVGGMVANLASKHRERFASRGLETISVERGFAALGEILDRGITQAAVIPVNWSDYVQSLPHGASVSLLKDLLPKSPLPDSVPAQNLVEELKVLPLSRQVERIRQLVESQAGRALGLTPGKSIDLQRPLHELGLDSLMSVELRNALAATFGRSLRATLLFDYPTLESLTRYLAQEVLNLGPASQASSENADTADESEQQELQNMSESEAESLLLEELNQLKESGV
ncbi:MAG: SDR family NAD(P)-dependent oxidoreductase [Verrucomicrobia bacterium]|nr:SDR family NAD(P)-dependent oxidoreductase [Verrucomicrobiota bacterium]